MPMPIHDRPGRFWKKVKRGKANECWEYQGAKQVRDGYGKVLWRSKPKKEWKQAHRIAWELTNGAIPDGSGVCVLHHCDNPPCCIPAHLFLGTRAANNADKVAKGR